MKRLLLLNGPNINMLGQREKEIYGSFTLKDIEADLLSLARNYGYSLDSKQSNYEGELVEWIQQANGKYEGIIFNPAAYTHTSIALRDAIATIQTPVIEVHLSNVYSRESFRHQSMLAPVCRGQIAGLGMMSYRLACMAFLEEATERGI